MSLRTSPGFWGLCMGAVGGAAGFFGPMLLSPGANQGPMLGLFITGPGGAIAGMVLGFVFKVLPFSDTIRTQTLTLLCTVLGVGTLWFALPAPAELGRVIDASIGPCRPASAGIERRIAYWEQRIAAVTYAAPRADWRADVQRMLRASPGVIVTLDVARDNVILGHVRPWNRGKVTASGWKRAADARDYFAGGTCESYPRGRRVLLLPAGKGNGAWPPDELPDFLGLQVLGPVPLSYLTLITRP